MKRVAVEANLKEYNKNPQTYRGGELGVHTPADMPVYIRAHRLMKGGVQKASTAKAPALNTIEGWTLEADLFTFGVTVYIRVGRDGTLKVFAKDADGTVKLEEWQR